MLVRQYKQEDYNILLEWYLNWNLPITPKNLIPSTSLIVFNNELPVCCGFVYKMSETPMYWMEGIISNPSVNKQIKKEGLDLLIKDLIKLTKSLGGEILLSSTPREGLTEMLKNNEFKEAPEQYFHVARYI